MLHAKLLKLQANQKDTMRSWRLFLTILLVLLSGPHLLHAEKIVITAPQTSLLPHYNLAATALNISQGSNIIKLDVVMTRDDQLVLLSDPDLAPFTNVAELYPERSREDGSYLVFDFGLEELQSLQIHQVAAPIDPDIQTSHYSSLRISSLAEVLSFLPQIEQATGKTIGIMIEAKQSWQHQREQKDLSAAIVQHLADFDFFLPPQMVMLASYDPDLLKALDSALPDLQRQKIQLYQFIDFNNGDEHKSQEGARWIGYDYQWMFTKFGLRLVSDYADGLGLHPEFIYDHNNQPIRPSYFENARLLELKLLVYPFDHLLTTGQPGQNEALINDYLFTASLDGIITTNPKVFDDIITTKLTEQAAELESPKTPIELFLENAKKEQAETEEIIKP